MPQVPNNKELIESTPDGMVQNPVHKFEDYEKTDNDTYTLTPLQRLAERLSYNFDKELAIQELTVLLQRASPEYVFALLERLRERARVAKKLEDLKSSLKK